MNPAETVKGPGNTLRALLTEARATALRVALSLKEMKSIIASPAPAEPEPGAKEDIDGNNANVLAIEIRDLADRIEKRVGEIMEEI